MHSSKLTVLQEVLAGLWLKNNRFRRVMLPEEYFDAQVSIKSPNSEIQWDTQTNAPIHTSYNLLTEVVGTSAYTSSELLAPAAQLHPVQMRYT